jgi:hypothetical protein
MLLKTQKQQHNTTTLVNTHYTMSTEIITSALTEDQLNDWVAKYEATGKLPQTKVPCSTGNGVLTTMFGDNLHKRVAKFGGIRNLLLNFKSREVRRAEKAAALVEKAAAKAVAAE